MRIAQVAPLYESVPPKAYGGTERVVSYLTEELVKQGHDVTLFASGDSVTTAKLIAPCARSLRLDKTCIDSLSHHIRLLDMVFERIAEFDVIHFHIDYLHFPLSVRQRIRHVTTLHGRLDMPELVPLYKRFHRVPLISISNAQRVPLYWANWQATVFHGVPENLYKPNEKPQDYLAFLGRISPEKGVDRAIEIARRSGRKIKIAAKIDPADESYFRQTIEPIINDPCCEYIGEIGEREKGEFLGNASALLFPIDWPEPFGLVLIEAMACGTPVIAYPKGSVPEILEDGVSALFVDDVDAAVQAVDRIGTVSRRKCREVFERRFTARRMACNYVKVFENLYAPAKNGASVLSAAKESKAGLEPFGRHNESSLGSSG
jgi:glycosyltransferase involved in cell wall biosynthesis